MARLYRQSEAKLLGLPGRRSFEIASAKTGTSCITLRRVEIPVAGSSQNTRGMHSHRDSEECIYVLSGQGTTQADSGDYALQPGDVIVIPPGERHMTRNTGTEPLILLCFFPVGDITRGMQEDTAPSL
jgi:quercetin dioxygenase-like cupin family protein